MDFRGVSNGRNRFIDATLGIHDLTPQAPAIRRACARGNETPVSHFETRATLWSQIGMSTQMPSKSGERVCSPQLMETSSPSLGVTGRLESDALMALDLNHPRIVDGDFDRSEFEPGDRCGNGLRQFLGKRIAGPQGSRRGG